MRKERCISSIFSDLSSSPELSSFINFYALVDGSEVGVEISRGQTIESLLSNVKINSFLYLLR